MTAVSIIICTRNRAGDLRRTLEAIGKLAVPLDLQTEVLVVDNGSTDHTSRVVNEVKLANMAVRHVVEPRKGKSHAYNTALAAALGQMFLCTDDDVRPPVHWIERMCQPLLRGVTDGVAGAVEIAPNLRRDWMEARHHHWLSTRVNMKGEEADSMTGANMAFHRRVLKAVPAFDPELGPGALGLNEEWLFSRQIKQAGFRIVNAMDVVAEHHFAESRLERPAFLEMIERSARSSAYIAHHWQHELMANPRMSFLKAWVKLGLLRLMRRRDLTKELLPYWEDRALYSACFRHQFMVESARPRNYEHLGLVKLHGLK